MAYALLISTEDIKKFTIVNGNLDADDFIEYIKISQDITIQNYLGTQLYEKLQTLILNDTINDVANAKYKTLLTTYIKPMLIHWAMVYYLPFAAYTLSNKGLFKHSSENASNVEKTEVDFLVEKERDIFQLAQNFEKGDIRIHGYTTEGVHYHPFIKIDQAVQASEYESSKSHAT